MPDPRVDAILAQFPGPVILHASRRKWLLVLLGCGVFTAGGIGMLWNAAPLAWLILSLFGTGTIGAAVMLLPGAGTLRLDQDGFEETKLFRQRCVRWENVSEFGWAAIHLNTFVVYDDTKASSRALAKINVLYTGHNPALADTYGVSAAALAALMARWRDRALSIQRS
jgi:hypothetical protein